MTNQNENYNGPDRRSLIKTPAKDFTGLVTVLGITAFIFLVFFIISTLPETHLAAVMVFLKTYGAGLGAFFGMLIMSLIGFFTLRMKKADKAFQVQVISEMDKRTTDMTHRNDMFISKVDGEVGSMKSFVKDSLDTISGVIDTFKDELRKDRTFLAEQLQGHQEATASQLSDIKIDFIKSNAEIEETHRNLKQYIQDSTDGKTDRNTYERRLHAIVIDRLHRIPNHGIVEITESIRNKAVEFIEYAMDVQKILTDKTLDSTELLQIIVNKAKKRSESIRVDMTVSIGHAFTTLFYEKHRPAVDHFMTSMEKAIYDPFNGRMKHIQDISVVFLRSFISTYGELTVSHFDLIKNHMKDNSGCKDCDD